MHRDGDLQDVGQRRIGVARPAGRDRKAPSPSISTSSKPRAARTMLWSILAVLTSACASVSRCEPMYSV